MDFDFRTFSTRSFERFTQALAAHILGPGIMIFGDGPDGAREASYEGTLDFPSNSDRWSGYSIMQTKFLQVPKSPADEANWLAEQLDADLQKFVMPGSQLRKPHFYILVSNARLSPKPESSRGKGGIAKIDAVFAKYRKRLALKDYRVWHLDQLSTFLMNADGLRRTYAAWLSSSDVIADLLADIGERKRAISDAMYRYLARELRTHQPIRLQQAGHSGDITTMVEDVFTDLPFRQVDDGAKEPASLLLASLLARARDCLDQASVKAQLQDQTGRPERILLLGGPGQGKSTLSQFMAQIFRANILTTDRAGAFPVEVGRIVQNTLAKSTEIGLGPHLPKRFPFRVDLPSFADKLSSWQPDDGSVTLIRYLCAEITRIADAKIEVDDLRNWIKYYPSIVILDGLDEVPPSANRTEVIRAISDFWDEAVGSDLLMIVTTRPQGYNNDLDPSLYSKLELIALNSDQALNYATKLAENRLQDANQRDRVLSRMLEAAHSPATSRLMVSPLQVAILLALIDQRGDAPSDRWSLFYKYFTVVLEREQGKSGSAGETMRRWGHHIIALHHKAGFLLHVEAETQGSSEAYLTKEDLHNLIHGQLAEEGFEGADLDRISSDLLAASTERLVLLVQREEGRFSFEVRSLQEFMAAAHLMAGREALVQDRLRTIANRSHWLHVFQIAASKCFSVTDSTHLRDTIITICRSVNEAGDEIDRFLRTGSSLALALLDDGLAYDQPRYRRLLFALALDLLYTGPNKLPSSLVQHCNRETQRTEELLRPFLASTLEESRNAILLLLLRCADKNQDWARAALNEIWPTSVSGLARIIVLSKDLPRETPLYPALRAALELTPLDTIAEALKNGNVGYQGEGLVGLYPCLGLLAGHSNEIEASVLIDKSSGFALSIESIEINARRGNIYDDVPTTPAWLPIQALITFHRDPNPTALAQLLEAITANDWLEAYTPIIHRLPWPLATVLWLARCATPIGSFVQQVREGAFGDRLSWQAAEARWRAQGVNEADLAIWQSGIFFNERVAEIGAPWSTLSLSRGNDQKLWVDEMFNLGLVAQGEPRAHIRRMIAFMLSLYPAKELVTLDRAIYLVDSSCRLTGTERLEASVLQTMPIGLLNEPRLLAELDDWGQSQSVFLGGTRRPWDLEISQTLIRHLDSYPGLIVFLGAILSAREFLIDILPIDSGQLANLKKNETPTISGYAHVFGLLTGAPKTEDIRSVFTSERDAGFPVTLLCMLIEGDCIDSARKLAIGELIAGYLNRFTERQSGYFMNGLRAIADQRLAPLREPTYWQQLELGEMLFAQTRRRTRPGS